MLTSAKELFAIAEKHKSTPIFLDKSNIKPISTEAHHNRKINNIGREFVFFSINGFNNRQGRKISFQFFNEREITVRFDNNGCTVVVHPSSETHYLSCPLHSRSESHSLDRTSDGEPHATDNAV